MRSAPSLVALSAVLLLVAPGAARADGVEISQRQHTADGWPLLIANHLPAGSLATPSWKVCTDVCGGEVASGASFQPGPTPAGTTFEASTIYQGVTTTARTEAWGGQVTNTAPPTFTGEAKAGSTLTPVRGTWSGGWSDDWSLIGMQACPGPKVEGCKALTASSFQPGNPEAVKLDAVYAGWYVGAVEKRVGARSAYTAVGYSFPPGMISPNPAPAPGQTVAAGPLSGPVPGTPKADDPPKGGESRPKSGDTAAVPTAKLRKRAQQRGRYLVLGTVRCDDGCAAAITVKQGRRKATWSVIGTAKGTRVEVKGRRFPGAGRLRVTIAVKRDGAKLVRGWVKRR